MIGDLVSVLITLLIGEITYAVVVAALRKLGEPKSPLGSVIFQVAVLAAVLGEIYWAIVIGIIAVIVDVLLRL